MIMRMVIMIVNDEWEIMNQDEDDSDDDDDDDDDRCMMYHAR